MIRCEERGGNWEREMVGGTWKGGDGVRADRVAWHFPVRTNCSEKSTKRQKREAGVDTAANIRARRHFQPLLPFLWFWLARSASTLEPNRGFPNWLTCWNKVLHFLHVYTTMVICVWICADTHINIKSPPSVLAHISVNLLFSFTELS